MRNGSSLLMGLSAVLFNPDMQSLQDSPDRYLLVDQLFAAVLCINIGFICLFGSQITDFDSVKRLLCALLIGTGSLVLPMMIFDAVVLRSPAPTVFWVLEVGETCWLFYAYFFGELVEIPESSDVHVTIKTLNGSYTRTYQTLPQRTQHSDV